MHVPFVKTKSWILCFVSNFKNADNESNCKKVKKEAFKIVYLRITHVLKMFNLKMVICKIFLKLYAIQENKIVMLTIFTSLNKVKTFR